jgi:hypothetical protein
MKTKKTEDEHDHYYEADQINEAVHVLPLITIRSQNA